MLTLLFWTSVCLSDNEDNSIESETDIREQASFTEQFKKYRLVPVCKCLAMPRAISSVDVAGKLRLLSSIAKNENYEYVTDHEQF